MGKLRILIGPFCRRMFSDGLRTLLDNDDDFAVSELPSIQDVKTHLNADVPTILILEHDDESAPYPLPVSPNVGVILVAQEGVDVQIALKQLDERRLRLAIGLVEQAQHPKVVSFAANLDVKPPCILPQFRESGYSVLSPFVTWLDSVFGTELRCIRDQADQNDVTWNAELDRLIARHEITGRDGADEASCFELLLASPVWRRRMLGLLTLDEVEIKAVCLAAAPDIDQKYCRTIGFLQGDYNATRPNASTLARLLRADLVGGDFDALCANRRVFSRFKLVRRAETEKLGAAQPGLCVAPALLDFFLGLRSRSGTGWSIQSTSLPGSSDMIEALKDVLGSDNETATICLPSEERDDVDECCAALLALGHVPLRVDATILADAPDPVTTILDHALRARVEQSVLVLERLNSVSDDVRRTILNVDVDGLVDCVVYAGCFGTPQTASHTCVLRKGEPDAELRSKRWVAAARQNGMVISPDRAETMSARLRFSLADISAAARLAASYPTEIAVDRRLLSAARDISARHAPRAVRRPPCTFTWDDIVLPQEIEADVRAISTHVENGPRVLDGWNFKSRLSYGRGIGALFSGQSGTGKTMTAQIIAADLGVDLMQVELSRCVSKYIGETEKNIDACFTAAEAASAVLLFDEADALFGKRTEIKDAHDRHANIETAYLLQRIEAYEGLVILTTNLKANIDAAFLRRLRFVIDYRMPGPPEREEIWRRAFPKGVPFARDVDVQFLARRLQLSGGSIQQIAVNAAFSAASESDQIAMRHIMAATRSELRKMGMLSAERDLRDPTITREIEEVLAP